MFSAQDELYQEPPRYNQSCQYTSQRSVSVDVVGIYSQTYRPGPHRRRSTLEVLKLFSFL